MCAPRVAGFNVPASAAVVDASGAIVRAARVHEIAQHDRVAVAFGERDRRDG